MKRRMAGGIGALGLLAMLATAGTAVEWSGGVRDQAVQTMYGNGAVSWFSNLLETKLVMEHKAERWRFYSDIRVDALTGDALIFLPGNEQREKLTVQFLRAFVRYFSEVGDFSVGKTYVNFGVPGIFNPFEIDRALNVWDLNYTKAGLLALSYDYSTTALNGCRLFFAPADSTGGGSFFAHLTPFDFGVVAIRQGKDRTQCGGYFKGDWELGLQGAWALRLNDSGQIQSTEANLGWDYSWDDSRWLVVIDSRYLDQPATPVAGTALLDSHFGSGGLFQDKFYIYAELTFAPDEFFQLRSDVFYNLRDSSALILPAATWVLADGLSAGLTLVLPTSNSETEFSRRQLGDCNVMAQVEAKW